MLNLSKSELWSDAKRLGLSGGIVYQKATKAQLIALLSAPAKPAPSASAPAKVAKPKVAKPLPAVKDYRVPAKPLPAVKPVYSVPAGSSKAAAAPRPSRLARAQSVQASIAGVTVGQPKTAKALAERDAASLQSLAEACSVHLGMAASSAEAVHWPELGRVWRRLQDEFNTAFIAAARARGV